MFQIETLLSALSVSPRNDSDLIEMFSGSCNIAQLIACLPILLPETIEIEGHVFLFGWHGETKEDFLAKRRSLIEHVSNLSDVERESAISNYNWIDLDCVQLGDKISEQDADFLINILAEYIQRSWQGVLRLRYPKKAFKVSILSTATTGGGLGIEFREIVIA